MIVASTIPRRLAPRVRPCGVPYGPCAGVVRAMVGSWHTFRGAEARAAQLQWNMAIARFWQGPVIANSRDAAVRRRASARHWCC
jgi:hypothetical protein